MPFGVSVSFLLKGGRRAPAGGGGVCFVLACVSVGAGEEEGRILLRAQSPANRIRGFRVCIGFLYGWWSKLWPLFGFLL